MLAALLVFVIPGVFAIALGRKAIRLGRPDGKAPALIGAVIGVGFVVLNVVSGIAALLFG